MLLLVDIIGGIMKIIKVDLGEEYKQIKVISLSDMHIGDGNCNIEAIKKVIEEIKESSNTFTIKE